MRLKNNKTRYSSPIINLILVDVEECIASASNNVVTIGGPNNGISPEIEDATIENKTFEITF